MKKKTVFLTTAAVLLILTGGYVAWQVSQNDRAPDHDADGLGTTPRDKSDVIPIEHPAPKSDDPLPEGALLRLGSARLRHQGHNTGLAYSPDGKMLVSGGEDGTVRVWDSNTGKLLQILRSHRHSVHAIAFSPKGELLASAGGSLIMPGLEEGDFAIRLWDCASWTVKRQLRGHNSFVSAVAFAPNGRLLASADDAGTIRLWNPVTGEPVAFAGHQDQAVYSLAFSPDGAHLAGAGKDRTITLWNLTDQTSRQFSGHTDWIRAVLFFPDGKQLITSSLDNTIRIWDVSTGNVVQTINPITTKNVPGIYRPLAISKDGAFIAGEGNGEWFTIWDARTGVKKFEICPDHKWLPAVAFSPDSKFAAAITLGGAIVRVDLSKFTEIPRGGVHQGAIRDLAFSPDGKTLATGGRDRAVRLWDVATGNAIGRVPDGNPEINSVAFSPDGRFLAGGHNGGAKIWRIGSKLAGMESKIIGSKRPHGTGQGRNLAFIPDGSELIVHFNLRIERQSVPGLRTIQEFEKRPFAMDDAIAISPDGKLVASSGNESTVLLWDVLTGKIVSRTEKLKNCFVEALAFSPDGKFVVSGANDGAIHIWSVATAKEVGRLDGLSSDVKSLSFSPDGRWLTSAGDDWIIRIWDIAQRKEVRKLAGHTGPVLCVRFSPDGKLLASGSTDSTVLFWDMARVLGQ